MPYDSLGEFIDALRRAGELREIGVRVSPRLDAVEEVSIATASQGADSAGQGAVQVKFVTKSGTNRYTGSGYFYLQRDWLNTNTWYNQYISVTSTGQAAAKPVQATYQPGFSIGGPVSIPAKPANAAPSANTTV